MQDILWEKKLKDKIVKNKEKRKKFISSSLVSLVKFDFQIFIYILWF